MLRSWLLFFIL